MLYETLLQANSVQQVENNPPYSAFALTRTPTPFPSSGNATTLLDLRALAQPSKRHRRRRLFRLPEPVLDAVQPGYSAPAWRSLAHGSSLHRIERAGSAAVLQCQPGPPPHAYRRQRATISRAVAAGQDTTAILSTLRPYPAFDAITMSRNSASSTYHSGQFKIERRFSYGLSLLGSYTFSKSIDNASDYGSGDASERVLDSYNFALQRGVSSFDVAHRFASAFTYELPFNPSNRAAKLIVAGWQVNAIVTLQSGQPFTPNTTRFDPYRNESFNRPDVVGDPHSNVPAGLAFNPAAFRQPVIGTFGNAGRNVVRGDGFHSVDLSLFKNFAITEQWKLQFRAEAVNSFNHVNYQGPVVNLDTTSGAFIAAAPPRIIQFGLKLSF